MTRPPYRVRLPVALLALGALLWTGCSDLEEALTAPEGPAASMAAAQGPRGIEEAIAAQERHSAALMAQPAVIGTAVGLRPDGGAAVTVFVTTPDRVRVPDALDGVPVRVRHTGMFLARSDPTTRARPAPLGFSVGHPAITAGSIGARVRDAAGNVYVLSNNHVLAASNDASLGDPALQPGPYDGGTLADQFGTLADYYFIDFTFDGHNTMDAAIALSSEAELGYATPADDGYGAPSAEIWGDADGDGFFDDRGALLGLGVKKYGRTTALTQGAVTDVNAFVEVCYIAFAGFCLTSGYFFDQIIIEPGSFSGGGDSGSLIVTDDGSANPVALLFAGSETQTIGNRIDLVLDFFGVTIDGADPSPPPPFTDIAITGVSAPTSVTEGATADVTVSVENVGNQDVGSFAVTLYDETDALQVGAQPLPGLNAGGTAEVTFSWNTTGSSFGDHTLRGSHDLGDENAANDAAATTATVLDPSAPAAVHVGDLEGATASDGGTWTASVTVLVHDAAETAVSGATVHGVWNPGASSAECVTDGSGVCSMSLPGIRKRTREVAFTVTSVTLTDGRTYDAGANHDADGDSDGTTVTVSR